MGVQELGVLELGGLELDGLELSVIELGVLEALYSAESEDKTSLNGICVGDLES